MKKKKERCILLHIFFVVLTVIGVTIMYNNTHYGEGINWLFHESYEDTSNFSRKFRSDIDQIFNYVKYKEVFETDGRLDYSKPIVKISVGPGISKVYTVDEMVRLAKSLGYYLDENFQVKGGTPSSDAEDSRDNISVEERYYDPDFQVTEPGDNFSTMEKLAKEVLSHLGNYYSFYYRFIQNPSNLKFQVSYTESETEYQVYTNISETQLDSDAQSQTLANIKAQGPYIFVRGDSLYFDTNIPTVNFRNISALLEKYNPYNNGNYYLLAVVDTSYACPDSYREAAQAYDHMRLLFIIGVVCLFLGIMGCAASFYRLVGLTGHIKNQKDVIQLGQIDKIPGEIYVICFFLIGCLLTLVEKRIGCKLVHLVLAEEQWYYGDLVLKVLIFYGTAVTGLFSLIRRYKAHTLWSGSLVYNVSRNLIRYVNDRRFTVRLALCYGVFVFINLAVGLAFAGLYFTYADSGSMVMAGILMGILAVFLLCFDFWAFHSMYKNAWEMDQIHQALAKISEGNTGYKINTEDFVGKEQVLAETINHISTGLETALQEKVRSERLKADLITNVSHDIKTPLTSIINYVDLIKREKIQDPKIQGYLEVLEQKSQRLKTLTEDLVEASKASSGNLKLDMADIDFVELIWQTNGEFEEKFAMRHLELVSSLPDEPALIRADGRHLWRVLENIYTNAFKYAMMGSRVYADIEKNDAQVVFTLKNVSENPLNIDASELTERFVRGDVARTTEGSGLGLSIARSLTELQGGSFTIFIDGDLFKVQVAFPSICHNPSDEKKKQESISGQSDASALSPKE